jgi:hypothetical protein
MDLPSCIQMWAAESFPFRMHSLAMAHKLVWCFLTCDVGIHIYNYIYIYIVWCVSCSEPNIHVYIYIMEVKLRSRTYSTSHIIWFFKLYIYVYICTYIYIHIHATSHVSCGTHCVVSRTQWQWEAKHFAIVQSWSFYE